MNWEPENEKNGLLGDVKSKFRKVTVRKDVRARLRPRKGRLRGLPTWTVHVQRRVDQKRLKNRTWFMSFTEKDLIQIYRRRINSLF